MSNSFDFQFYVFYKKIEKSNSSFPKPLKSHPLRVVDFVYIVMCTGVKPSRVTNPGTNCDERCLPLRQGQPLYQRRYKSRLP